MNYSKKNNKLNINGMSKKIILVAIMSVIAINANAQFGKMLKKTKNIDAGKKMVKAATLSDEDMATLSLQSVSTMDG